MSQFFIDQKIKVLKSEDFDDHNKLTIKTKKLTLILFYDSKDLSKTLVNIWNKLSETVTGINFYICNVDDEEDLKNSFTSIIGNESHPINNLIQKVLPFIVTYKDGEPKKIYDEILSYQNLLHYCYILAPLLLA